MTSATQAVFFYTPKYREFDYGPSHPMKIRRLTLTHDLIHAYGLFHSAHTQLADVPIATEDELLSIHTKEYLDVLRAASAGASVPRSWHFGLGTSDNPIFEGVYAW
ncbi:MAG: hypothetical protein ACREJW_02725, partial [Candidatus Methylomirabilales bacterium]